MLPLVQPSLATVAILTFLGAWNEFLVALIMTTTEAMKTVPVGVNILMRGVYTTHWENVTAGAVLSVIPVIIVFLAGQRLIVGGLTTGAVK